MAGLHPYNTLFNTAKECYSKKTKEEEKKRTSVMDDGSQCDKPIKIMQDEIVLTQLK